MREREGKGGEREGERGEGEGGKVWMVISEGGRDLKNEGIGQSGM